MASHRGLTRRQRPAASVSKMPTGACSTRASIRREPSARRASTSRRPSSMPPTSPANLQTRMALRPPTTVTMMTTPVAAL